MSHSCISGGISDKIFLTNIIKEVWLMESKYKSLLSLKIKFIGQEISFKNKWFSKVSNWPQSIKPSGDSFPTYIELLSFLNKSSS